LTDKLSNKDKQDWQNFIDSSEKLYNKDKLTYCGLMKEQNQNQIYQQS